MSRVVLDTNVIVSAFLSPAGTPANILQLVIKRDLEICHNTAILVEYEQVLCRPKFAGKVNQPGIQRFFELLHEFGTYVVTSPGIVLLRDETDRKFYDVAKTGNATLVTGNKKHYPEETFIMNPAEFMECIKFDQTAT